jgi:hypothetical protein
MHSLTRGISTAPVRLDISENNKKDAKRGDRISSGKSIDIALISNFRLGEGIKRTMRKSIFHIPFKKD